MMKLRKKGIMVTALVLALTASVFSGCAGKKVEDETADGKTVITVGDMPDKETSPKRYETMTANIERFEKEHPDIKIKMDTWSFDTQTYMAKAEGGTLPTIYYVPLTESKTIMDFGYAADITDEFKKRGFYDNINEFMLENITRDGRVYFLPSECYDVGLVMNVDLLKQAGYVNEDGTPHEPQTWEEMAEMAVKVKEVTGKSGFVLPTTENNGGWRFTPIAWSFGVEFMKQDSDGKWKATFDSPEAVAALQFVKDLKWKYDVLPANTLIGFEEVKKQLGTGEAAMTLAEPQLIKGFANYGLSPDSIGAVKIPAGPKRRVSLMGGSYFVINKDATPEQVKAALDWREFLGDTIQVTDGVKETVARDIETLKDNNQVVGFESLSPWKSECEVRSYKTAEYAKNSNIDMNHIKLYNDKNGVEYQSEEPIEAQALYGLLDSCIQEVLTNKDADCAALIKKAASDFQSNYLD